MDGCEQLEDSNSWKSGVKVSKEPPRWFPQVRGLLLHLAIYFNLCLCILICLLAKVTPLVNKILTVPPKGMVQGCGERMASKGCLALAPASLPADI